MTLSKFTSPTKSASTESTSSLRATSSSFTPGNLVDNFNNLSVGTPASTTHTNYGFSGGDDTPTPPKYRVLAKTPNEVFDDLTNLTLQSAYPELTPRTDMSLRQHLSLGFAQRSNGEPATCFVYMVGGEIADYQAHGKLYLVLANAACVELCFLPPRTKSAKPEFVARFNDVRDAAFAIGLVRATGNDLKAGHTHLKLRVLAISAFQYCTLLQRVSQILPNQPVTTLETLPKTFASGYDGQILVQARHSSADEYSTGQPGQPWRDGAVMVVKDYLSDWAEIFNIEVISNEYDRPVVTILIEFCQHGEVDHAIDWFRQNPHGVVVQNVRIWGTTYEPAFEEPATYYCSIAEDEIYHPINAFRRRRDPTPVNFDASINDLPIAHRLQPADDIPACWRRHQQSKNNIDANRVAHGLDIRTTVMFRNIPAEMTTDAFEDFIRMFVPGRFDFIYLRKDFHTGKNVGYAFVNLIHPGLILVFLHYAVHRRWPHSHKTVDMSYAQIQGKDALVQKFRNSVVMEESDDARPRLYHAFPHPFFGRRDVFPHSDNSMKMSRSRQNADEVGLFSSRRGRGRQGHFDRGNPRGNAQGAAVAVLPVSAEVLRLQREVSQLKAVLSATTWQ